MMTPFKTADLWDEHGDLLQVVAPVFRDYGGLRAFCGPIATVKLFEDNTLLRQQLETPGEGRVLVVDGGGSLRCAIVGDMLAQLAIDNHWAGLLVYGCIRDAADIGQMAIGVKAINTNPKKSLKRGEGQVGLTVQFAGVTFQPGHFLYADADGVVVAPHALLKRG